MSEERVTNATTGGEKGSKLARHDLIPTGPLTQLAEMYGHGAKKYAPNNWRRGYDWSLSYAALQRHAVAFWGGEDAIPQTPEGEDDDPTAGVNHLVAVAWHAFAMLEWMTTHPELDDRPVVVKQSQTPLGQPRCLYCHRVLHQLSNGTWYDDTSAGADYYASLCIDYGSLTQRHVPKATF